MTTLMIMAFPIVIISLLWLQSVLKKTHRKSNTLLLLGQKQDALERLKSRVGRLFCGRLLSPLDLSENSLKRLSRRIELLERQGFQVQVSLYLACKVELGRRQRQERLNYQNCCSHKIPVQLELQ